MDETDPRGATELARLASFPNLRRMLILWCQQDELVAIAQLTSLRSLALANAPPSPGSYILPRLDCLSNLHRLEELHILDHDIPDALTALTALTSLHWRSASEATAAASFATLCRLSTLESINISSEHVPSAALAHLSRLTRLSWLDASVGVMDTRLLRPLTNLTHLRTASLSIACHTCLSGLRELHVGRADASDGWVAMLPRLTALTMLQFDARLDCSLLPIIAQLPALRSLTCGLCHDDLDMHHLSSLTALTALDVSHSVNFFTVATALAHVAGLTALRQLRIRNCRGHLLFPNDPPAPPPVSRTAAHLAGLAHLELLDLRSTEIAYEVLLLALPRMQRLHTLYFSGSRDAFISGAERDVAIERDISLLTQLTALRFLGVSERFVAKPAHVAALLQMPSLQSLKIRYLTDPESELPLVDDVLFASHGWREVEV